MFATSSPAPSGPIPGTASTIRIASGNAGKNAALWSPWPYPVVASRRNHCAS